MTTHPLIPPSAHPDVGASEHCPPDMEQSVNPLAGPWMGLDKGEKPMNPKQLARFLLPLTLLIMLAILLMPSRTAVFAQDPQDRWAGVVSDENGAPLAATVTINSYEGQASADGSFELYVPRADDERYVINAELFGYVPVSKIHVGRAIEELNLTLKQPQRFDIDPSQEVDVEDERGTRISIPANSLVDANGNPATGPLQLQVYTYDLTQEEMPGDMGALNSEGQPVALESAGVFYAQFTDADGNEYNLAPDAQAEISIPIEQSIGWPLTIDLWSYDKTLGDWIEEGQATQANGRYVGSVAHFSAWNFDIEKTNPACIEITIDALYFVNNGLSIGARVEVHSPPSVRTITLNSTTNVLYNLPAHTWVDIFIPPAITPYATVYTGGPWGGTGIPPHSGNNDDPYPDCNGSLHLDDSMPEGTIGGIKFNDLNGNGVQDAGELGLSGWTILLENENGGVLSAVTDANGNYSFTGLLPGTYTVSEQFQTGWTQTHPASASHLVTLASDEVVGNINFGNWQNSDEKCYVGWDINFFNTDSDTIEVGMRIHNDSGSDGTYQVDVVGYPGFVVTDFTLTTPFDGSQPLPTPPVSVANGSSVYVAVFMSPLPIIDGPSGQYQVIITNEATGHSFGCSAQLWQSDVIGVRPERNVLVKDIAFGAAQELRFELHNIADREIVANIEIDEMFGVNGHELNIIRLNGQEPGQNVIDQIVVPEGEVVNVPVNVEFDEHVPEGIGDIILLVDVDNDGQVDTATSVMIRSVEAEQSGSIHGMKWNDLDGDGVQDADEPGVGGVTIVLTDAEGNTVATTTTAADGSFSFESVPSGTYTVSEEVPDGWTQTFPVSGTHTVTLEAGEVVEGIDFGNLSSTPVGLEFDNQTLYFEPNEGQTDSSVRYLSRGMGGMLFFKPDEVVLALPIASEDEVPSEIPPEELPSEPPSEPPGEPVDSLPPIESIGLRFVGANSNPEITGAGELPGVVNYFMGNEESEWITNLSTYAGVSYSDLYSGISLHYDGNGGTLKGTYVVAPGADPNLIRWHYEDVDSVTIDPETGDLLITFANGEAQIIEQAPVAWQDAGQERVEVEITYLIDENGDIGFAIGDYNPELPLIIDPTLIYSTYLGGGSLDFGTSIAVDNAGNAYVTGGTYSVNFPVTTSNPSCGSSDVFVSKFNASGTMVWSTYVCGDRYDVGYDIAFNNNNNRVYVTGVTWSNNFPGILSGGGAGDAFVFWIHDPSFAFGSLLIDGSSRDYGFGLAIDSSDDLYVVGGTWSGDLRQVTSSPITPLQSANQGGSDMFIVKLNATLIPQYGTYLGGASYDCIFYKGCHVAVDDTNGVYVTGNTYSSDFPILNPLPGFTFTPVDVYVTKLKWGIGGLGMVYSTPLGGTGFEFSGGIAVDSQDNAIVVGTTFSNDFPTTPFALQGVNNGSRDAFATKVGWTGTTTLLYSTYLGGDGSDGAYDVAVDSYDDNAYITGYTRSPASSFPTVNVGTWPGGGSLSGSSDAFVAGLTSNGANFIYSTYLGGSGYDVGLGIAADEECDAYLTGYTRSNNLPTQSPWDPSYNAWGDAFVTKIGNGCPPKIDPDVNNLVLNEGDLFSETITVTIPGQPCVLDVYFLADTTGSMGSQLSAVKSGANQILDDLKNDLPNCDIGYGVGDYKDFQSPTQYDPYAFQHGLLITPDNTAANRTLITGAINSWTAAPGSGHDGPEGQLFALRQVAIDPAIGWRSSATKKMVVWFGDQPGHEPVCSTIHATPPLIDIYRADTASALNGASIAVIALDLGNLNGNAFGSDYGSGCPQLSSNSGQATYLVNNAAPGGAYQSGVSSSTIVSAIVSQITAANTINNVSLVPSGISPPFVISITPAGGYGPLDPTVDHTLPFEVVFEGTVPCTDTEQVFTGTLDVVVDGVVVTSKTVTITVPPCCTPPPPDMVAWWHLDEVTGTLAADIAMSPNDGTHINNPIPIPGMVDGALSFNGSNQYVEVPDHSEINFGQAITGTGDLSIDAWVKTTDSSGVKILVDKRYENPSTYTQGYSLYLYNGELGFQLADGNGSWYCSTDPIASSCTNYGSGTFVADGEWHLVAVTVDRDQSSGGKFYVDGALVATFNPTIRSGSLTNTKPLRIASRSSFETGLFNGAIDEVELFKRALTEDEINAIYRAGSSGKCKCEEKEVTALAGEPDDFDTGNGTESPSPSVGLQSLLQSYGTSRNFDTLHSNQQFFHTFSDLLPEINTSDICSATLEIGVKPGRELMRNDTISLWFVDSGGNLLALPWGRYFGSGNAKGGLFAYQWGSAPKAAETIILDLDALPLAPEDGGGTVSILGYLNLFGFLDVYAQDDTGVDYVKLTVHHCCDKSEGPDIELTKSHTETFTYGQNEVYTLDVTNVGDADASGPITVIDRLPAGMSFVSGAPAPWTCSAVGQNVTCTHPGPLAAGASSSILLTVAIAPVHQFPGGSDLVTNCAQAFTAGDVNRRNDADCDPTIIVTPPVGGLSGTVSTIDATLLAGILVEAYRLDGDLWEPIESTTTTATGEYTLNNLLTGSYRVHFVDPSGTFASEYYDDVPDFADTTEISVTDAIIVPDINAILEPTIPPEAEVEVEGGSTWIDPSTGEIWFRFAQTLPDDASVTIQRDVTCPDGVTPTSVVLLVSSAPGFPGFSATYPTY